MSASAAYWQGRGRLRSEDPETAITVEDGLITLELNATAAEWLAECIGSHDGFSRDLWSAALSARTQLDGDEDSIRPGVAIRVVMR